MYNKLIDMLTDVGKNISLDIVLWAGVSVIGIAVVLGVLHQLCGRKLYGCLLLGTLTRGLCVLYAVFALWIVLPLFIDAVLPALVCAIVYILYSAFFGHCHCCCHRHTTQVDESIEANDEIITDENVVIKPVVIKEKKIKDKKIKVKKEKIKKEKKTHENKKAEKIEDIETTEKTNGILRLTPLTSSVEKEEAVEEPTFVITEKNGTTRTTTARTETDKMSNIARLAEEIERKRQKNIEITDGVRENKFSGVAVETTDGEPKVVARRVTETVSVKPIETTTTTGFTAQRITETKTTERTTTTTSKTDEILAALEKLKSSMKKN